MNDLGMNEITRFERYAEAASPPRPISPPPIPPDAMAAVAKANRLSMSVSNELPLEWPQNQWVSRPVLALRGLHVRGGGFVLLGLLSQGRAVYRVGTCVYGLYGLRAVWARNIAVGHLAVCASAFDGLGLGG